MEPPVPVKALGEDGKGRPRINHREVLNGILWVLRLEAAWQKLEQTARTWVAHPSGKTGCAEGPGDPRQRSLPQIDGRENRKL